MLAIPTGFQVQQPRLRSEMVKMSSKQWISTAGLLMALSWAVPACAQAQATPTGPDSVSTTLRTREKTPQEKRAELEARVAADPADGKAWNDLGVIHATEGDFSTARDCFISAVQTAPTEGDFHRNLGLAFSRLGMDGMAVREFEAYHRFDKLGGKDYWRLIGDAQQGSGMMTEAKASYQDGIDALGPELSPELMRLVLALLKLDAAQGDETGQRDLLAHYAPLAASWLQAQGDGSGDGIMEARHLVHNRVTMLVADAQLMEQSGLPSEATAMYKEAYDLAPDRLDLLPRLVDAQLAEGDDLDARVAVRLARERYPDQTGTWIASGKVYEKTGKLAEAADAYQKAYAMDSSLQDVRVAIGNLLLRLGRDAEASRFLSQGVDMTTTKPEIVYNYAVSLMREKKYHAAIPSLRAVVVQKPEMEQAWLALGKCLQLTKQYEAAIKPYEQVFAMTQDPKLIFLAGSCAQKAEIPDRAITDYQKALQTDPGYVKAQYNLSLAYMDAGLYEQAAESFDDLIAMEGPTYRAYYSQGLAYYYLKMYESSLDSLELALDFKETPVLLNAIGRVYAAKGNKKEAMVWYDQAKKLQEGS